MSVAEPQTTEEAELSGADHESEPDPLIGSILGGRYEILELLARGGMGRIYRAVQLQLDRDVALKILDVRAANTRSDFRRRFFLEASTAARLQHPNTVVTYDYGTTQDQVYFIALELVEGNTLQATVMQNGPLDAARVANIGAQVCGSLAEAHALDIVHRDMKPSNVLLTHRGNNADFVKVVDFGLAKVLGDDGTHDDSTQAGVVLGTPRYMSPEQIQGRDLSAQSDQYSLGAVMYFALTGRAPFEAEAKFDILLAHMQQEPMPLSQANPAIDVPPTLERIVMRCLAKAPEDRFADMEELAHALRAVEQELRRSNPRYDRRSVPRSDRPSQRGGKRASDKPANLPSKKDNSRAVGAAPSPASVSARLRAAQASSSRSLGTWIAGGLLFALAGGLVGASVHAIIASSAQDGAVQLISSPAHARVMHEGADLGDTPATLIVPEGQAWMVEVSASGYRTRRILVTAGQHEVRVALTPER